MIVSNSDRAAHIRQDTWRRRHDRRNAPHSRDSKKVLQAPATLAQLLVRLSRGQISAQAARDIAAISKGGTTMEIIIDAETGVVEHWVLKTNTPLRDDGASVSPTVIAPAA